MEQSLISLGKTIQNGNSAPIGLSENGSFMFLIKDTEENINKFIQKIEEIESISENVKFINQTNKKTTNVHIAVIRMNTGNYYPLYVIEGLNNMLSDYLESETIELLFFNGKEIKKQTAIIQKEKLNKVKENNNIENGIKIFNFIKEVKPYELEALVAQVQRGEAKPEISYQ